MADDLSTSFFPTLIFYDISFLLSHPLYFSYLIFFSPYLFRFISFISPLFLTTSLLLLLSLLASTLPLSNMTHVHNHDEFSHFQDLEIYKIVFDGPPLLSVGDGEDEQAAVAVRVTDSEEERSLERLFEELDRFEASTATIEIQEAAGELQKLETVMSPISGEDQETDEDSSSVELNPWRMDSSSSFGSCGSTTASSPIEEVAGELQKLEQVKVSSSGEDQKTAKSISTAAIEMKDCETRSHVRELLQKYQPVTSSISGEYQKSVQKSFSEKSKSTAAIEINNNKTTSHVRGTFQKTEPVTSSISSENKKSVQNLLSVKSNSMPSSEMKNNETASHIHGVIKKLEPVTSALSVEDQITVKSHSMAAIEMKNNKTTSHVHTVFQKSSPVTSSISDEDQKSVKNSPSQQLNYSWRLDSSTSYGSMRKEKEWKRTLACKLFEERNNSSGGEEGMDSLWEAYEDDNSRKSKKAMVNKNKKKIEFKYFDDGEEDEDEDDDEDDVMSNGQLCCLKALKLSTGKMNLGMGKPNLVKITKALKGFGWLHHVGTKHGKKH